MPIMLTVNSTHVETNQSVRQKQTLKLFLILVQMPTNEIYEGLVIDRDKSSINSSISNRHVEYNNSCQLYIQYQYY